MKEIWKFKIKLADVNEILMPQGAEILTIKTQHEQPCIWALVESNNSKREIRKFLTFGSGHPISISNEENIKYIGTYFTASESLVWHVFEKM